MFFAKLYASFSFATACRLSAGLALMSALLGQERTFALFLRLCSIGMAAVGWLASRSIAVGITFAVAIVLPFVIPSRGKHAKASGGGSGSGEAVDYEQLALEVKRVVEQVFVERSAGAAAASGGMMAPPGGVEGAAGGAVSAEIRDALQQMTDSAERAQRNTSTLKGEVNELMKHVRESKRTLDSVVVPKLHLLLGSPSTSQGSFAPAMGGMSAMLAPAVHQQQQQQQQQQPASRPSVQRATSMSAPASPVRKPPTRANSSPMHASNVQTSATFAAPQSQSQSQAQPQQPQPEPQQSQVQPQQPQLQSQPQPQPPQQPPQQPQSQPQPAAASASMFTHAVPSAPAGDTMFGAAQPAPATAPVDGAHAPRPPPTVAPAVQPQARTFPAVEPINTSALAAPVTRVRASSGHPGEDFLARVKESVKHERMCVRRQENESNQRVLPPRVISPRTEFSCIHLISPHPPSFFFLSYEQVRQGQETCWSVPKWSNHGDAFLP